MSYNYIYKRYVNKNEGFQRSNYFIHAWVVILSYLQACFEHRQQQQHGLRSWIQQLLDIEPWLQMVDYQLVLVHLVCQWSPWCKQILRNTEMLLCSFFAWGSQKKSPGNTARLDMMGKSWKSSGNEGVWVLSKAWLIWVPRHVFDIAWVFAIIQFLLDQSCWTIKHTKHQPHKKLQHSVIILSTTSELSPQKKYMKLLYHSGAQLDIPTQKNRWTFHIPSPTPPQPNSTEKNIFKKQFHQKNHWFYRLYWLWPISCKARNACFTS